MKHLSFLLVVFIYCTQCSAQTPFGNNIHWTSGYQNEISGETLAYTSAYPDYITHALLTRANTGEKAIEWETAPVPSAKGNYAYFRWIAAHSTGSSGGDREFDLYVNNKKMITFTTHPGNKLSQWSFTGNDSTKLVFEKTRTDGANDAHGVAYLRIPYSLLKVGQPVRLKVIGHKQESNDWYMTFKYSFEEKADATALPFLLKDGKQPLLINVLHFGKPEVLTIIINHKEQKNFNLANGLSSFEVPVAGVVKPDSIHITVKYASHILLNTNIPITPVVQRDIHFIHHSHTDIGYSHLQPEVERIHTKNIRDALVIIEKTKKYPDYAKFKWNIESLWAVENFLKEASPQEIQKFTTAVKDGNICLSALYANILTGLSMPEEMFHYTDYADSLRNKYGLKIASAMASDVPGFSWATVAALAKGGVKYFSSGPNYMGKNNPYLGDRVGHFVKTWGDKPVWWQSPSGEEKVLFWTGGRGYSSWHGIAPGQIFQSGRKRIAEYMNDLTANKYPYQMVQWRYNCIADNAPLDSTISDFVKDWNEKYQSPKIILNTTDKMFEEFEKRYGSSIPTVKGDITPYWEDGAASTAYEEGENRKNSLRLQQLETLQTMLSPNTYNSKRMYEAWKNIIMFHEHTWGAHNSITTPDINFVTEQWRIKKDFMLDANKEIDALTSELLSIYIDHSSKKIAVVNTLSWKRRSPVYLPAETTENFISSEDGSIYPLQQLSDGRKMFIATNLKPMGVTYFELKAKGDNKKTDPAFTIGGNSISNQTISVDWDNTSGDIMKLTRNGVNYTGTYNHNGLNSYLYVPGRNPATAVTNGKVSSTIKEQGLYLTSVEIKSDAPGTNELTRRISLLSGDDKVLIENILDKKAVREKEGVYFSFPFNNEFTQTTWDAGYGTVRFLKDQLPGSSMDYISTKRWLDASSDKKGIQLLMTEAFMMSPDSLVDETLYFNENYKKWRVSAKPTSQWFSYVMNNYWHTNYKADQSGTTSFNYALRAHDGIQNYEQEKAAMEFGHPVVTFPVKNNVTLNIPEFKISNDKIVVTSITIKNGGGYSMRLFNPVETVQNGTILWKGKKVTVNMPAYSIKEISF